MESTQNWNGHTRTLLTLADGRIGTPGAPIWRHSAANPRVFPSGLYDGEGSMTQLLTAPV